MECTTSKLEMRFRRAGIRKFLSSSTYREVVGGFILTGESVAMETIKVEGSCFLGYCTVKFQKCLLSSSSGHYYCLNLCCFFSGDSAAGTDYTGGWARSRYSLDEAIKKKTHSTNQTLVDFL